MNVARAATKSHRGPTTAASACSNSIGETKPIGPKRRSPLNQSVYSSVATFEVCVTGRVGE